MNRIGIRPALDHRALWFHIDQPIAKTIIPETFRLGQLDEIRPTSWAAFDPSGRDIMREVLQLFGVTGVNVEPHYLNPTVTDEYDWLSALPLIVAIIRDITGNPDAPIYPHPPLDPTVPQWHIPLLKKLFSPTEFARPRLCQRCPFAPRGAIAELTGAEVVKLDPAHQNWARIHTTTVGSTDKRVDVGDETSKLVDARGRGAEALGDAIHACPGPTQSWLQRMLRSRGACGCMSDPE
jgi:hypothetical protein